MTAQLRRLGALVNRKRVARLDGRDGAQSQDQAPGLSYHR